MSDKIRNYTNSDGMQVSVSEDSLRKSVEIKLELQNSSPSRRCDWKLHQKLMIESGYEDSDINEGYRCLVKDFQKSSGLLTPLGEHLDLRDSNKLSAISRILGDIYSEKRENQLVLQEINRYKRELSMVKVISEEIRDAFLDNINVTIPHYVFQPRLSTGSNKAIVVLTDIHVGVVINDIYGNSYNYEIAKKRLNEYKRKVLNHCNSLGISEVTVCGLGDFVEHVNMRYKQNDSVEFKLAQQILKASELIIDFLVSLSEYLNVEYIGIAGNHDRFQGDKDIAFVEDNANVIINNNIKTFIKMTGASRLTYVDIADGATEINKELNGKNIKLVHGHLDGGNKKDRLMSYIAMENKFYDCLVYGHLHHHKVEETDNGRISVGVGSVAGRNDHSKLFGAATDASQLMLVVTGDGDIIPVRIGLQLV